MKAASNGNDKKRSVDTQTKCQHTIIQYVIELDGDILSFLAVSTQRSVASTTSSPAAGSVTLCCYGTLQQSRHLLTHGGSSNAALSENEN